MNAHKVAIFDQPEAVKLISLFSLLDHYINEEVVQRKACLDLLTIMNWFKLLLDWPNMISDSMLLLLIGYAKEKLLDYDNMMLADEILALDNNDLSFDESDRIAFRVMNCIDELGEKSLKAWYYLILDRKKIWFPKKEDSTFQKWYKLSRLSLILSQREMRGIWS
jgi:hypothetical protein